VEEVDFLTRAEELALIPGAVEAIAALNAAGIAAVLVTNQSGIARGFLDELRLAELHALLAERLAAGGARLDGVYFCPHHPEAGRPPYRRVCDCRKPAPGLIVRAARELELDLARSWVVGDSARDLEAGAALGIPGILVETGKGAGEHMRLATEGRSPEHVARNLAEAVARILKVPAPSGDGPEGM
jgi:D-glycero-D-manno-heptose 1,7-bisphosphate phosphatase